MANFGPSKTWTDGEILSHTDLNAALLDIINNVTNNNIDADNIDETDDYTWSGANSFTGGHSITVLSNAAASIVTGTTLEWDPGDGGQMTDNSSGISLDFKLPDAADNQDTFASIAAICLDDTSTSEDGELSFRVATAGTNTEQMTLSSTALTVTPAITASGGITSGGNIVSDTDSTDDLGTTGVRWANLFVDDVTVTNNVTIGGTLTLTGGITLNGNTTIGDSSADTLTVNSTITSNLIFTDNTYDIGASGATRPRDLFLSRNAVMGGTLGVTGLITATGGVSGALTGNVTGNVTGNLTGDVTGNISGNVTGGTISGTTGTFSGDLTVDTNILKVDSVNNSVGFGLTNPSDYAFNGTPSWVASGGASNASVIVVSGTTSSGYLAFADGTTGTDRYSGNIQYNHSTNTMSFKTGGGVEAMTINSAQDLAVDTDTLFVDASADRVGIGTSSPADSASFSRALDINGPSGAAVYVRTNSSASNYGYIGHYGTTAYFVNASAGPMAFYTNGSERARIDSSGNFIVGKTTTSAATAGASLSSTGGATFVRDADCLLLNRPSTTGTIAAFRQANSEVGTISVTASATAYNTSSDYRLKENIVGITDGITRIKSLKPSRFNFIAEADRTVDGFVAHEVSDVVPEAISGAKDAVDDEGNPEYQGIDQSKLVPLLTAALQEAITKIETLETKVAALEAA